MKKLSILAIVMLFGLHASAQLGIKVGGNFSSIHQKYTGDQDIEIDNDFYKMKPGFKIGVTYDFGDFIMLQPGLYFSQKGTQFTIEESVFNLKYKEKHNFNYIELPINVLVRPKLGNLTIFAGVGATFSYAVGGKYKIKVQKGEYGGEKEGKIKFGNGDDEFKAFDFGVQALAGLEYNNISLAVNYNLGLSNMIDSKDFKQTNRVLGVTLGYTFRSEK